MRFVIVAVVVLLNVSVGVAGEYEALFDVFSEQKPDVSRAYSVGGLMLEQPDCTMMLDSGTVVFSTPVNGRIYSAVFTGSATIDYTPPVAVERNQMKRFLGTENYSREVMGFFFCFTDSTMHRIIANAQRVILLSVPASSQQIFDAGFARIIFEKKHKFIPPPVLYSATGDESPWFFAMAFHAKEDPAIYQYDARDFEGVSFAKVLPSQYSFNKFPIGITRHYPAERYAPGKINDDDCEFDMITPVHYDIDCSIAANLDMTVAMKLSAVAKRNGVRWVSFGYYYRMKLTSVKVGMNNAEFFQLPESGQLYVKLPAASTAGEKLEFSFNYTGKDVISRSSNYTYMNFSIQWYPQHNGLVRALYDVTYHVDEKYKFVGAGKKVFEKREGDVVTSKWKMDSPVRNVSFNIGPFYIIDVKKRERHSDEIVFHRRRAGVSF